jgi:hypothetical protein
MKDRRKDIRPAVRLQMLSVMGGLAETPTNELLRTLTALYVSSPLRWQTFMDEARVLIDGTSENLSGFAETASPEESELDD